MPVESYHSQAAEMLWDWQLARDLYKGERAVKLARDTYLPPPGDLADAEARRLYEGFLARALFYNGFGRTVDGLSGMAFRKAPEIELPPAISYLEEDAGHGGEGLAQLAQTVVEELLMTARGALLADAPAPPGEGGPRIVSRADALRLNLRPYLNFYRADEVVDWRSERVGGRMTLTEVRLRESYERPAPSGDPFDRQDAVRYRVLDLDGGVYRQRVFEQARAGGFEQVAEFRPEVGGRTLDFIPLSFVGGVDNTPRVDKPPLLDLARVNLSHYRTSAELENALHLTGVPFLFFSGHTPDDQGRGFVVGSRTAYFAQEPGADAKWVTYGGEGTAALEKRLEAKEQMMARLGARMLAPEKRAAETAETEAIRRSGEHGALASLVANASDALSKACGWCALWAKADPDAARVTISRDFLNVAIDPRTLEVLFQALQAGRYSFELWVEALKRAEHVPAEMTVEEVREQVEADVPLGMFGREADQAA